MSPADSSFEPDSVTGQPPIQCAACESAFSSNGRPSFLLLDQHTVPVIGCADHLSRFSEICGYTTENAVELLDHRPAGGIGCPSCHLAPNNLQHPVIPVQDGAVGVLACPAHQTEIVGRFRAGLDTQQQLTTSLNPL